MTRGRKPKKGVRHTFRVTLLLWEDEDDDLLTFLEGLPPRKRAAGIKLALRSGGALSDLQSADLGEDEEEMDFDMDDFIS